MTDITEVIVFTQIGTQIEGIERVTTVEILATYEQSVFAQLSGSSKRSYIF